MAKKPKPSMLGNHKVGYGKPPKETRFKPGHSGNPTGRPKGAKNRMPATYDRLKRALLDEAYREIEVTDKSGPTTMTVARAVMRSLSVKAAKGNAQAQKLFLTSLAAVESEQKRETLKTFDKVRAYQKEKYAVIEACKAAGEEPPYMLPHPNDISFDLETGEVFFPRPSKRARQRCMVPGVWYQGDL